MTTIEYLGRELDLFGRASRWKHYWASIIAPYIRGRVLEVGAGNGNNTELLLSHGTAQSWACLEPDPRLLKQLAARPLPSGRVKVTTILGAISDMSLSVQYDTILYIDVLEHIRADRDELCHAVSLLKPDGHIVVLAPAYPVLFSQFDRAVGHFRRYTRKTLADLTPPECDMIVLQNLDAVGFLASLGNRYLLKQPMPTANQVLFWDRCLVPLSRVIDRVTCRKIGRSVLGIWKRGYGGGS